MNHNFDKTNMHYVNSFKHNVEKFSKYVWPSFNIINESVNTVT